MRAYPRSRGGTFCHGLRLLRQAGLSPLARGNPGKNPVPVRHPGPIPARAGEPASALQVIFSAGAYPRSRGGTAAALGLRPWDEGLSPLARGNPCGLRQQAQQAGPIPARAGEPAQIDAYNVAVRAYPRSRGGTSDSPYGPECRAGLSPLARGNLSHLTH